MTGSPTEGPALRRGRRRSRVRRTAGLAGIGLVIVIAVSAKAATAPRHRPVVLRPTTGAGGGPGASGSGTTGSGTTGSGAGSGTTGSGTAGGRPHSTAPGRGGTVTGQVEFTPYGPVQVRLTLSGGRIVDVTALQLPSDASRSVDINNYAAPLLRQEVLSAQSAAIDTVSGASYTSDGYAQSVQSALDTAGAPR